MYYKIHLQANIITKLQDLNYSKKKKKKVATVFHSI